MTHSGMGLPTDMWLPVTAQVKPQYSNQYTLGSVYYLKKNYKISLEAYYKSLYQIYTYRSGVDYLAANNEWEASIEEGNGSSYGAELMLSKTGGKLEGWVSYTWSKTIRSFEGINHGEPFPYKYDRTHQVSIISSYRITPKLTVCATWIYATGMAYTLATEKYITLYSLYSWNIPPGGTVSYIDAIEERNNARMPDYHRLDLSLSYQKEYKRLSTVWNLSVYNVYNRFNPYLIYWEDEIGDEADRLQKQVALFSVIPSFSIRIIF
jgi:outer membrane receptor protein involved in Fe transport